MSDELLKLRNEIDRIDEEILARLAERARCAQRVGEIKRGVMYYRPEREAQVLRRLAELNPGPLSSDAVKTIFREVMSACLGLEQPLRVAYLGPAGTFSESASRKHFGSAPNFLAMAAIDDVFRAVEAGNADYGVVPVENSTEGAVGGTLDLLLANPLKVCGEVRLRIHQQLMSRAEGIGAARRIYSHAQSLAQCHEWLNRNLPHLPRIPVASNAEAARRASEEPGTAAVAGDRAAEHYGLAILAPNIEDEPNNTTRFLILGDYEPGPSGRDRTSLVLSARNRAGAVYEMLTPFATRGVSMTKFESRPSKVALWEYLFFVDIEGHRDDTNVAAALEEVGRIAGYLKVLGSYPMAVL